MSAVAKESTLKSFAGVERFLKEVSGDARRPGYVLLGDESFLYEMARKGVLKALVPDDLRDFCLHDLDLATTTIFDALDLAQTPSLMSPFQVLFIRGLKALYGRGQKKDEFAALDAYFRSPNPQALLILVADHISLPQDLRQMDMTDKERAEKIRETLGDSCGIVELQRVSGRCREVGAARVQRQGCHLHRRCCPRAGRRAGSGDAYHRQRVGEADDLRGCDAADESGTDRRRDDGLRGQAAQPL